MKQKISCTIDVGTLDRMDSFRGLTSRSAFVEHALEKYMDRIKEEVGK